MKFFESTKRLALEFLAFKKYKQMNTVLAVFVGIFMFPFFIAFAVMLAWTFMSAIFFTIIEAPIKFLHNLIKDETKEHQLPFRMLIYYLSWPIIFIFYVFYALMIVDIYVCYFFTQCIGYVTSLGGYHFHISPLEASISKEVDKDRKHNKSGIIQIVVCVIMFFLGALLAIIGAIIIAVGDANVGTIILIVAIPFFTIPFVFEGVFACLAYRDWKKADAVKEISEQPKAE